MAGKQITQADLSDAVKAYCCANLKQSSMSEDGKIRIFAGSPDPATDKVLWLEDGNLRGSDLDFTLSFAEEFIVSPVNGRSQMDKAIMPSNGRKAGNGALVKPGAAIRDIQVAELTFEDIKTYICPAASDQEAFMFLKLCQARGLNPFLKEVYLIKYGGGPATMVVGKDAFTRRAEEHPQFDGFKAGIIVKVGQEYELDYREGTFLMKGEELVGAWSEVYRKDRTHPFKNTVSRSEYDTGKSNWLKMPATMLRKVSLVQSLREAFASEFSGMYDQAEIADCEIVES